jgi:hypothetical protein
MSLADFTVLPFAPNWAQPPVLASGFANSILTSRDGAEQRTNHRAVPRRAVRFVTGGYSEGRAAIAQNIALEKFLRENIGALVGIPAWWDATELVGINGAVITGTELANRPFVASSASVERYALLWRSYAAREAVIVSAVNRNANTLTAATAPSWTPQSGDLLLPLIIGRLLDPTELELLTTWHGTVPISVDEDKAYLQALDYTIPAVAYRGRQVFPFACDWSSQPRLQRGIEIQRLEGWGRDAFYQSELLPREGISRQTATLSRAQRAWLQQFFADRLGRHQSFWLPHNRAELALHEAANSGATQIKIDRVEYASDLFQTSYRRSVLAIECDGRLIIRRVEAATLQTGHEVLTLESALPIALPIERTQISFLRLVRFDTDDLRLSLVSPEYANATVRFRELAEAECQAAIAAAGAAVDLVVGVDGLLEVAL